MSQRKEQGMWIQYILILVTSLLTKLISLNENVGWVSGIFSPQSGFEVAQDKPLF